jgi:hypothetical protein
MVRDEESKEAGVLCDRSSPMTCGHHGFGQCFLAEDPSKTESLNLENEEWSFVSVCIPGCQ